LKYFEFSSAAKRYAVGRPYIHSVVVDRIEQFTGESRFRRGLDVACGTGQSSNALKQICDSITATDISRPMLDQAPADDRITYLCCPAEQLALASAAFDIVTVGLAFHWFDRDPFLQEANRVLDADGWLIIYQNYFYGKMKSNPDFEAWMAGEYLKEYPVPPRDDSTFGEEQAAGFGFSFEGKQNYASDVGFTIEELSNYLSTQTNMIDAIESGRISTQKASKWLKGQLARLFVRERETLRFGGWIIYLRKEPAKHIHSVAAQSPRNPDQGD
jgi:SAM-dependent methyltransferase|tara:strand:+ start:2001 stop:2816 length:816 start_codon:yes stop_codon:yes gene_type:complete